MPIDQNELIKVLLLIVARAEREEKQACNKSHGERGALVSAGRAEGAMYAARVIADRFGLEVPGLEYEETVMM